MITSLIAKVNEQQQSSGALSANQVLIQLDTKSFEKIIEIEELVKAEEAKKKDEAEAATNDAEAEATPDEAEAGGGSVDGTPTSKTFDDKDDAPKEIPVKSMAEIVKGPEVPVVIEGPVITARALYVMPAKKSNRRGEKSGCAYLVLTAPPPPETKASPTHISAAVLSKEEAPKSTVEKEVTKTEETVEKVAEGVEQMTITPDEKEGADKVQQATANPAVKKDGFKEKMEDIKDAPSSVPLYTAAEKSRLTAVAKLQLVNAIDALSSVAKEDSRTTTEKIYGNCQVAASASGKAWRDKEGGHRDRREGTIETTGDYKQFFNKQNKAQEERQSRPKPAPGGGGLLGTTDGNGDSSSQPISAIVLHLRAKHQEQNKRKKASKKASKDAKNKGGKQPTSSSSGASNKDGGRRSSNNTSKGGGGGGGRRGRKDNKKGGGTQAPVMLMKPKHNGSGGG